MTDLAELPTGTVTFLLTDLEGSTRLLQAHPDAYREAVARHHALLRDAVEAHRGAVFETAGDAVCAAFANATDAVGAARGATGPLAVRTGLHTGEAERHGGHYLGMPLYRCARPMGTAHGGQVVLSEDTAGLVREALPAGASLRDALRPPRATAPCLPLRGPPAP
jgi:class 3 adenylate cyclase